MANVTLFVLEAGQAMWGLLTWNWRLLRKGVGGAGVAVGFAV